MPILALLAYLAAFLCWVLAAFGVSLRRVALVPLGLALAILPTLISVADAVL